MNSIAEGRFHRIEPLTGRTHPDVLACVQQTEKIERLVPAGILLVFIGLPVLSSLLFLQLGMALIKGIVMFFVAGLVIKLVEKLILSPMRHVRYKAAAETLGQAVRSTPDQLSLWRSWHIGAPGALAVTQSGHILIADRSTDYDEITLQPSQIANVSVEREATQITNTKHGGSFTFGGASGGFLGAFTSGGRSRSVTRTVETAFLELRYQLEPNGAVYTTIIPFGADRRGADALCATLSRLEQRD